MTGAQLQVKHPLPAAAAIDFHTCRGPDHWTWAAAIAISAALRRGLQAQARARLLLSGGHSPTPVLQALSRAPLEWDRIDVALVDERWLLPEDPDSNAYLVREHLLRHYAAAAHFQPMTGADCSIEGAVKAANLHACQPATVVVLGMGADGHTASLFPGMRGLDAALSSQDDYVATDATGCAGAGPWPRRISLTPAGLASAHARLLLIRGAEKRATFERALAGDDAHEFPVRIAFTSPGARLQVYWSP